MLAVCWYLGWDAGRNRSQWLIVRGPSRKECNQRTVNLYPVKSQCLLGVRSYTNVLETSSQCPILTWSYPHEKLYFDGKVVWWVSRVSNRRSVSATLVILALFPFESKRLCAKVFIEEDAKVYRLNEQAWYFSLRLKFLTLVFYELFPLPDSASRYSLVTITRRVA